MNTPLDFYYDVACPFAYLAFKRLGRLRAHARVRLRPILLGGLLRDVGAPTDPNTVMAPARAAINRRDIELWAALSNVPLTIPAHHPQRTVDAMRVIVAAPLALRETLSEALYDAYWQQAQDVTCHDVLERIIAPYDLSLEDLLSRGRTMLREATTEAADAGAFGVPSFVHEGKLWWGQDRMGLVLGALGETTPPEAWIGPPAKASSARVERVRFFHDVSSPFSYLASTQIDRIAAAHGVQVEWVPMLLGALFRTIGTPDVPLHAMNATRQAYTRRDMEDWAQAWGVPVRFPTQFPIRSVLPLRAMVVQPRCAPAIYAAAWANDRRVDDAQTLAEVLGEAGFDPEEILPRCQDPQIKQALRDNTDEAVALGLCGVPSVLIAWDEGDPLLLWGQDRLPMLRAALMGWRPSTL